MYLALILAMEVRGAKKLSIGEATSFCEKEVPIHCVATTCPLFCSTIRTAKQKASCAAECTKDKRCKIRPAVGSDDPKNMILDAQNRNQLWACIAEMRDPAGTSTGRQMTPWKELETTEFKKATGRS